MKASFSDTDVLAMLHLRDGCGLTYGQIATHMRRTRNSVVGAMHRVDAERRAVADECACLHDENKDGGMMSLWWRDAAEDAGMISLPPSMICVITAARQGNAVLSRGSA